MNQADKNHITKADKIMNNFKKMIIQYEEELYQASLNGELEDYEYWHQLIVDTKRELKLKRILKEDEL